MTAINENTLINRKNNIPFKKLGKDLVILDLNTGDYFALNEVAGFIWERINGKDSLGKIAQKLARVYNIKQEPVKRYPLPCKATMQNNLVGKEIVLKNLFPE